MINCSLCKSSFLSLWIETPCCESTMSVTPHGWQSLPLPERLHLRSLFWCILPLSAFTIRGPAPVLCPSPPAEFSRESLLEAQGGLECPLSKETEECSNASNVADASSSSSSSSLSRQQQQQQQHTSAGTPEWKAPHVHRKPPSSWDQAAAFI